MNFHKLRWFVPKTFNRLHRTGYELGPDIGERDEQIGARIRRRGEQEAELRRVAKK